MSHQPCFSGIPYTVRHSKRAKRVSVRVSARKGVELVLPSWVAPEYGHAFLASREEWVRAAWAKYAERRAHEERQPLLPEVVVRHFDERCFTVHFRLCDGGAGKLRENGDQLLLSCPSEPTGVVLLQRWLKEQARMLLVPLAREEAARFHLSFERVQVRLQRSRWGSCSARGTISLNAKLLFLPLELARYVVLHELAHIRHSDHSKDFWAYLTELEPRASSLDAQLDSAWQYVPRWADMAQDELQEII